MFKSFATFLSMIRFSHTLFALPFALFAAVMAWRAEPQVIWRWQDLLGVVLAMVMARSAAMAFNRLTDCQFDAENPRTAGRHLPQGQLGFGAVVAFAVLCSLGFIASTLCFLPNRLPLYLSIPVLVFLCAYSLTKRFTSLSHFWLGAALMLAPICAWIALRGEIVMQRPADLLPSIVLGGAVLLWVAGFDIIYACQDFDFDVAKGLQSIPARLGVARSLRLAATCHFGMIVLLALLPVVFQPLGWIYGCGAALVAALLVYEHRLVRPDDLTRANMAFFHVNAVVSLGLFAFGAIDLLTGWMTR